MPQKAACMTLAICNDAASSGNDAAFCAIDGICNGNDAEKSGTHGAPDPSVGT